MDGIVIKSSWIVGRGDVIEVGSRHPGGKKMQPRKKRGKPLSPEVRLAMQAKIAAARERRRCGGGDVTRRR